MENYWKVGDGSDNKVSAKLRGILASKKDDNFQVKAKMHNKYK